MPMYPYRYISNVCANPVTVALYLGNCPHNNELRKLMVIYLIRGYQSLIQVETYNPGVMMVHYINKYRGPKQWETVLHNLINVCLCPLIDISDLKPMWCGGLS